MSRIEYDKLKRRIDNTLKKLSAERIQKVYRKNKVPKTATRKVRVM